MAMRTAVGAAFAVSLLLPAVGGSTAMRRQTQSDRPPLTSPKNGEIVVYGCVEGTRLVPYLPETGHEFGRDPDVTSYRLRGPKAVMEKLREEHQGQLVEIAGTLRRRRATGVPQPGRQRIGDKTTVFVEPGSRSTTPPDGLDPIASDDLEIGSFVVLQPTCPGR